MKAVRAMPDGFEIEFTLPVDLATAEDIASYSVVSYNYKYHSVYGSPPVNQESLNIKGVKVSADGLKARIVVDGLRQYYIHTISVEGVREKQNFYSVIHPDAYYTLNAIPTGEKLALSALSTRNSALDPVAEVTPVPVENVVTKSKSVSTKTTKTTTAKATEAKPKVTNAKPVTKAPTYAEVKGILTSNTCLACHSPTKKQIGPSFAEIAKRKYSNEKIVDLIYNPKPENWPDYATQMPPMPQVSKADGLKIAAYINSLR